jgi:hypothetical protein
VVDLDAAFEYGSHLGKYIDEREEERVMAEIKAEDEKK